MSWVTIARKDFRDARRSLTLWMTIGVFTFIVALLVGFASPGQEQDAADMAFSGAFFASSMILPIVMLVMGYLAIAGEYESGTIRHLLGMPVTRADVVAGKLAGRSIIAVVTTVIGVAVGAAITVVRFDLPSTDLLVSGLAITALFAVVFTSVAVAISAVATTRAKAMGGAVGVYFATVVVWIIPFIDAQGRIETILADWLGLSASVELAELASWLLSPTFAYIAAIREYATEEPAVMNPQIDPVPFYLEGWFALLILMAWTVVPLTIGYYKFRSAEIA
jgi:ABC-2 type transport system permease protein